MFSDFEQIKAAVRAGRAVYWKNRTYHVAVFTTRHAEYWRVVCDSTRDCASLFYADGIRSDYRPADFFTVEE